MINTLWGFYPEPGLNSGSCSPLTCVYSWRKRRNESHLCFIESTPALFSSVSLQLFSPPCSWTTSGLKSQGRLSVGSNRDREISMSVGLGRSKLDSKGGVVGGNIDVNTLEMVCKYTNLFFHLISRLCCELTLTEDGPEFPASNTGF